MKRVPDPHAVGAEGERSGEAAPVEDAAGRHHRDAVAHGVDDLGDERHGRHLAGVTAGLGALGHDEVASGLDGAHGVVDLAAHVDDEHVGAVALLDHLGGDAERRHEGGGAAVDDDLHLLGHAAGHGGEEVDGEGLVRGRAHGGDFGLHGGAAHGAGTEAAEAARIGHRGHQFGVRDTSHAGQHDGVLDAEQLCEASSHVPWPSFISIPRAVRPASAAGTVARAVAAAGEVRRRRAVDPLGCILTRTFLL